ncbi:MAG: phasin family protein [Gammaproteobacteria bacterium]|nr:phasin family protein [Gammaproteobacteria bacterium]NIR90483.1 phasin family protein [Gammaproteobacteria bacterium]NIU05631.1 phasin family protein [Gammaproteobacteria bacterium]NIV52770.1 TIGR01841 family phasin [Gammaproteobacteria bacterium]NIX86904.1 TIGR01841 family phasin [Gammaproteobacteria bacterium]
MQTDILSNIEKLNKTTVDAAKRLGEINTRAFERLSARQIEATSDCLEGGFKHVQMLGEAKGLRDVLAGQSRLAAELNEKVVEHMRQTAAILAEVRGEYASWVEDGLKAASESPVKKTATKKSAA